MTSYTVFSLSILLVFSTVDGRPFENAQFFPAGDNSNPGSDPFWQAGNNFGSFILVGGPASPSPSPTEDVDICGDEDFPDCIEAILDVNGDICQYSAVCCSDGTLVIILSYSYAGFNKSRNLASPFSR